MSLAQLEYFVAVAEEGHLGRAAARLHISQPPLTRQIRSLEDELGARLFARTPRGMALLPPGERFLERARAVLEAVDAARRSVRGGDPSVPGRTTTRSTRMPRDLDPSVPGRTTQSTWTSARDVDASVSGRATQSTRTPASRDVDASVADPSAQSTRTPASRRKPSIAPQ